MFLNEGVVNPQLDKSIPFRYYYLLLVIVYREIIKIGKDLPGQVERW